MNDLSPTEILILQGTKMATRKKRKAKQERRKSTARRRAEQRTSGYDFTTFTLPEGMQLFQLKAAGTKRISVVPFIAGAGNPYADEGELHYEKTVWVHRGIGPDNSTYVCPAKTQKKPCPICDYKQKLNREPDADDDVIKGLAPKERQLWLIYDHGDEEQGVQLWDFSYHLFGNVLDEEIKHSDEDDGYDLFYDPDEGLLLKIGIKEDSYMGRSFYKVTTINFKDREPLDEDILEQAVCLDDLLIVKEYEELKAIFLQAEESEEDEDEEEEKPKSKRKKSSRKKPVEDDEEEEEDYGNDVTDEFPEAEEIEAQVFKKGRRYTLLLDDEEAHENLTKKALTEKLSEFESDEEEEADDDDEEWDDEDEDWEDEELEEEEEEKPKKKTASRAKGAGKTRGAGRASRAKEPEEDEEDEDEEEEEEKPAPKRTRKSKKK
mgnify:CR=1 FL=1